MQKQSRVFSIWLMWALASFFYAYQYILRVLPNIMMRDILEKFHIDASLFGQYSGLYYIGYAGMHIPIGILLDKYGPKWILPLCMMLTVVGLMPLLYADNWVYPGLGRLLIGMGSSAAILGVFKIIRMSFPEERFTFILGCSVTIGLIGAIYGGRPVNSLIQNFGSTTVLQIIILLGIVLAITTFWVIPHQKATTEHQSWLHSVKAVLSNRQVIMICLFSGLMVGPLEGFADVWGKEYLKLAYKLNDNVSASLPSLIFLGMCLGSPILSWITEKTKAYFGFIILSGIVMGISFCLLLMGQLPLGVLTATFVVIGVFCAYQILAIYKASTYGGEKLVGLTTACANMIIMTFGYVFHSLIGHIMAFYWDGSMNGQAPVYDPHAYTLALGIIPLGLMAGSIGFIWLATSSKKPILIVQKS